MGDRKKTTTTWKLMLSRTGNDENDYKLELYLGRKGTEIIEVNFAFKIFQLNITQDPVFHRFDTSDYFGYPDLISMEAFKRTKANKLIIILYLEIIVDPKKDSPNLKNVLKNDSSHQGDIEKLLNSGDLADMTLECQDETELKCHRLILASASPVFKAMLYSHNTTEKTEKIVRIEEMDPTTVKRMLVHMYTGKMERDLNLANLILLLKAADRYDAK